MMPAKEHPDYYEEKDKLETTLSCVEDTISKSAERKKDLDDKVGYGMQHFNGDASQDYIDLMINTQLKDYHEVRLQDLVSAREKPYFARINFAEDKSIAADNLYIGKMSLAREKDQKLVIIDWRAPISNLYYEGRLGEASYICPDGEVKGVLTLKRQFTIEEGQLKDIFDIDVTASDELLQSCLGASADNRLKDIVSTIQEEQNKIIRGDMWKPMIVQGAAGSGKTTIALHRIAYLVYTYEKTFDPESFMIIAPSKLFLNYISEVLPELGVDKVKQTTFKDFCMDLLKKKIVINDENEKLIRFAASDQDTAMINENRLLIELSKFKCSMQFKEIIDRYIEIIEKDYIPKKDFCLGKHVIVTYDEINSLFSKDYKRWPLAVRINEIKKTLTTRLKIKKEGIKNSIIKKGDVWIYKIKSSKKSEEEKKKLISILLINRDEAISELESSSKRAVKEYLKEISQPDPFYYYKNLYTGFFEKLVQAGVSEETGLFTADYTKKLFKKGVIDIEDLAPIVYLKYCIYGMDEKIPVKHIIIDEAQDFSAFQIYVLRKIIKDSSFTILGDRCQGIHSYRGIKSWEEIRDNVFEGKECQLLTLEKSYRTTVEIMNAANKVLDHLEDVTLKKGKPVIRHGSRVEIIKKENLQLIARLMADKIEEEANGNYKSFAIICKTMEECREVYKHIRARISNIHIITGQEKEYKSGITIVPSYLSKGLEFDIVFIANGNSRNYKKNELDIKLLYVSMTRPLHKLFILYHGDLSPMLQGI